MQRSRIIVLVLVLALIASITGAAFLATSPSTMNGTTTATTTLSIISTETKIALASTSTVTYFMPVSNTSSSSSTATTISEVNISASSLSQALVPNGISFPFEYQPLVMPCNGAEACLVVPFFNNLLQSMAVVIHVQVMTDSQQPQTVMVINASEILNASSGTIINIGSNGTLIGSGVIPISGLPHGAYTASIWATTLGGAVLSTTAQIRFALPILVE